MFREIRGIEEENIVSVIQGLPSFYFGVSQEMG